MFKDNHKKLKIYIFKKTLKLGGWREEGELGERIKKISAMGLGEIRVVQQTEVLLY